MAFRDFLNQIMNKSETVSDTVVSEAAAGTFFKASAISTAISYRANALSMSSFTVYNGGEKVQDTLWYLLNYSPNPNQNASQFWNHFVGKLMVDGEALVVPIRNSLYVADGWSLDGDNPTGQDVYGSISIRNQSIKQTFRASRAFYFKLDDANTTAQISEALEAYGDMMAKAMTAYKQSCGQKYKIVKDRAASGDREAEKLQQQAIADNLKTFIENANAVYMETAGRRLEPVKSDTTVEPESITAMRKDIYDAAAVALKVPKSVMYGDMTNMGDLVNVLLTFAVDPVALMIGREFTRKNFTEDEIRSGSRVYVDTSTVKHIDLFDIAPDAMNLISSGVRTIDDLLEVLGENRQNTPFTSQRWMTKNIGRIEDVLANEQSGGGE